MARTLVVMRHSKAEAHGGVDSARVLADRGHVDAADAGRFLARSGIVPDHVLVSAAARTQETWADVLEQVGGDPLVDVRWDLYSAGAEEVLAAVRTVPEDASTVLVVGHNPTAAHVAHLLDDGSGSADAREVLDEGFATSALAVFSVDAAWGDVGEGAGKLLAAHVGRG